MQAAAAIADPAAFRAMVTELCRFWSTAARISPGSASTRAKSPNATTRRADPAMRRLTAYRNGFTITTPARSCPSCRSSVSTTSLPAARAASTIAASQ